MSHSQYSSSQSSPRRLYDNEPNERSTPASVHIASPPSMPQNESPSPRHRRTPTSSSSKRNSFFGLRSRSNTTSSSSSSMGVGTTSTGAEDNSRESSQSVTRGLDASPTLLDRPHSRASSLFSRSKKVSRQTSKLSLITWDGSDTWLDNKRYGRRVADNADTRHKLKRTISAPFNFQHVAHSQPKQFANLEQTSQNELIAEYWAVRAGQRPRPDLRGIRAADLHSSPFSTKASQASASFHGTSPLEPVLPPLLSNTSPQRVVVRSERSSPTSHPKPLSAESFSQPIVRKASQKMAFRPAPGTSSLGALEDSRLRMSVSQDPHRKQGQMLSATIGPVTPTRPDRTLSSRKPLRALNLAITLSNSAIAQAITTDDTGRPLRTPLTPAYSSDLQDVPEEYEGYFLERNQADTPGKGAGPGLPVSQPSTPAVQYPMQVDATMSPPATPGEKKPRPMSQASDTLGTPFTSLSRRLSLPISLKDPNAAPRGFDTSWYDDIDYCYENAAEASCDFQWGTTAKEPDNSWEYDLIIQSNRTKTASTMAQNRKPNEPATATGNGPQHHKPDPEPDPQPDSQPDSPALAPTPRQDAMANLESRSRRSWQSNSIGVETSLDIPTPSSSEIKGDSTALLKTLYFPSNPSSITSRDLKNHIENEHLDEGLHLDGLDRHDLVPHGYSDLSRRRPSTSTVGSVPSPNTLGSEENFLRSRALGSLRGSPSAGDSSHVAGSRRGPKNFDQVVDSLSQDIESLVRLDETLTVEEFQEEAGRSSSRPNAEAAASTATPLTPPPKSRARSSSYSAGAVPRQLGGATYKSSLVPAPLTPSPRSSPPTSR